ncbi:ABC transporter permease [Bifidobacterium avesanii]|uniref:ABC transporter permease subunit n=1 Tax=Bifidobacterium avesanii TaxID=1798157 RepID=A0A7K3TIF8_9BIFI|nr:ABC transporter permease [Bifidobacterium avesanii]KAB8290929.1 diguanylate cyclase [Bifidobacterium avesanii]NEG78887.1 ABC transporter permease subunit [Bifidobacterium avesanii]
MLRYTLQRFLLMIPTLLGTSILVFALFALMPGDFFSGDTKLTQERLDQLREAYGLNKPVVERYFTWLGQLLRGDWGFSMQYNLPVSTVISNYIWNSFIVSFGAFIIAWALAIAVSVYSSRHQYSFGDRAITFVVFALMSLPSFFVGLVLIKVFALNLGVMPVGGLITTGSNYTGAAYWFDVIHHAILPMLVIVCVNFGPLTRYFRTSMLDTLGMDFIRTARAKGLSEASVVGKHALRNAMLPAITLLGFRLPALFSGAIITEQIFSWPGIGRIQFESVTTRDYALLMSITMLLACLTIVGNFIADVLYTLADPRVRITRSKEASR